MLNKNIEFFTKLNDKPYFSTSDLVEILKVKPASANVLAARYTKKGIFIRLKKDFYVLSQTWRNLGTEQLFRIANMLQVPSYISFMTTLSYYEVTTQVQQNFYESAAQKRSGSFNIKGAVFNYYKLQRKFYFDFNHLGDMFISTKEKAFIDAVYLFSFGKYRIDFNSIDMSKLDKRRIKEIVKVYPAKTLKIVERLCNI